MKRLAIVVALPFVLFGLERVNLVKDHSFENNSDVWKSYAKTRTGKDLDPSSVSRHDSVKASSGLYSAYGDTRIPPSPQEVDSVVIAQGFGVSKKIDDLDSMSINYSIIPIGDGSLFARLHTSFIAIYLTDPGNSAYHFGCYVLKASDLGEPALLPPTMKLEVFDMPNDSSWYLLSANVGTDLYNAGFSGESIIDSFLVMSWGGYFPPWRGQKIYWDDIRLIGYADYDVGVKGILSGDSVWKSTAYTPTARIKNFGRKAADTFLVIAEIKGGSGTVYADTLPYALPADTEDTVSFKEFTPPDASNYTLTIRTVMTPDESDEDDAMSKTLYGTGITETPSPSSLQLEVTALSSVRYFLPSGERGTLTVYDPSGRRIESYRVQGSGSVNLKSNLSSGVYFIKLEAGKASVTKKAVVLR